jgi:predicted restriction endonuclease
VCGRNIRELLVASHVKPWKDSDDKERLDFYNSLLLCPAHNVAYDGVYISFDNNGVIVLSNLLDKEIINLLQLVENTKIKLESRHLYYMERHIHKVFKHKH